MTQIDPRRNLLVVGPEKLLYSTDVTAEKLHWTSSEQLEPGRRVQAKIRSRSEPAQATVTSCSGESLTVTFERPQRAATPGQALVLYDGEIVLAGGTIVAAA